MNPAKYLSEIEKSRMKFLLQKVEFSKTLEEVKKWEYSICLILEKALLKYRREKL